MRLGVLLLCILVALRGVEAPKEPVGEIGGFVRSAITGEPLRSVQVSLRPASARERSTLTTTTDAFGTFLFTGLPAGAYRIALDKAGYLALIDTDSRLVLKEGDKRTGLDFALIPAGAVSGTVLDASGEPLPGAEVRAYQIVHRRGLPHLVDRGRATSDDVGQYRIYGLRAGRYILRASPPRDDALGVFYLDTPPAYYPGASGPAQALPVTVNWGEQVNGINLELTARSGRVITGAAFEERTGAPCGLCSVRVVQLDGNYSLLLPDSVSVASNGLFVIRGLASGTYQVIARQKGAGDVVAQQVIRLDSGHVGDAAVLHVGTGAPLSGKVVLEGLPKGVAPSRMVVDLESEIAPWAWPRRDAVVLLGPGRAATPSYART